MRIQRFLTGAFRASGTNHAAGLVPDPGATAGTTRFLREDATWQALPAEQYPVQGRLTITSGDPFNVAGTASSATLYFTPLRGNAIGLFDGTSWASYTFAQLSAPVPANAVMNDVFIYNFSGSLALQSVGWSNNATRAIPLGLQDGIYVKSDEPTKRYLGSFYSSSGTVFDTPKIRTLWNYYNRTPRRMYVNEVSNWTLGLSGFWRFVNANANNRLMVVCGVKEDTNPIHASVFGATVDSSYYSCNIGYDSTSTLLGEVGFRTGQAIGTQLGALARADHMTDIGLHYYYWCEYADLVGTNPVYMYWSGPGSGDGARYPNGINMNYWC